MKQYVELVNKIINTGKSRDDRTGVGTLSIFNHNLSFNLEDGFPLLALKETRWGVAFLEMLWFLRGEPTTKYLTDRNCKLWEPWAESGYVGPIYGWQWRRWGTEGDYKGIDQIANLIQDLQDNPHSRRLIVSAWNVSDLPQMGLPPCHYNFQCYVDEDKLSMTLFMRSSDVALGLPFNIAQYALLLVLLARASQLNPHMLHVHLGDAHIYKNHLEQMKQIIQLPEPKGKPQLVVDTHNTDIDGYRLEDFQVVGYNPHPFVKLEVAV